MSEPLKTVSFAFAFPGGDIKWVDKMTREELLHVIASLKGTSDFWRSEAYQQLERAR